MRLHVLAFGFALGLTWALGIFISGLVGYYFDWGNEFIRLMSSAYIGFEPTLVGSLIGSAWGFVDAFIGGIVIALIYNLFCKCCSKSCN